MESTRYSISKRTVELARRHRFYRNHPERSPMREAYRMIKGKDPDLCNAIEELRKSLREYSD